MGTTRKDILDVIKTTIENIHTADNKRRFNTVKISRMPPNSVDNVKYPICFIYSDREVKITEGPEAVIGRETWEWNVILEIWAVDSILESLLSDVHDAMFDNYTFNNHACYSERIGIDFLIVDAANLITAMLIPYKIVYRHTSGNMSEDEGEDVLLPSSLTDHVLLPAG